MEYIVTGSVEHKHVYIDDKRVILPQQIKDYYQR